MSWVTFHPTLDFIQGLPHINICLAGVSCSPRGVMSWSDLCSTSSFTRNSVDFGATFLGVLPLDLPCATHVMVDVDYVEDVSMLSMLNCSIRWAKAFEYLGGRYFWLSKETSFHMSLVKLNL